MEIARLLTEFDPGGDFLHGAVWNERRLSGLAGAFADEAAFATVLAAGDPVIYAVAMLSPAHGRRRARTWR